MSRHHYLAKFEVVLEECLLGGDGYVQTDDLNIEYIDVTLVYGGDLLLAAVLLVRDEVVQAVEVLVAVVAEVDVRALRQARVRRVVATPRGRQQLLQPGN